MKSKMIGLMITLLMVTASAIPLLAAAEQTHSRSTGNEAVSVDVSEVFYERGNSISVTVMSTNLDPATEYALDWELCFASYNNCNLYSEMAASGSTDPAETEGTIDLGSGNMFTTSIFTFTDPGLFEDDATNGLSGIQNQSYIFRIILSTQGVELDVNQSSDFVLGGEMRGQSYIDSIDNLFKDTPIQFNGRIYFDYDNRNLMNYDLDCDLYEGTSTTSVDTYSIENIEAYQSYVFFSSTVSNGSAGDGLLPVASSGIHHVECSLTRNIDGTVMGTIVSNDFNVIDADVTGSEEIHIDDLTSVFYERSTAATPLLTVSVDFTDMYVGETYTADWELCFASYSNCDLYNEMAASGGSDPAETEGQISFTPTSSSSTQTFDFTDPGLFVDDGASSISGIRNQSYHFRVTLSVQGVELDVNQSSDFVLGGEMRDQSYIDNIENLLKNTAIEFNGRIYFDYDNRDLMDYDLDCDLYEGTSTTSVDSYTIENIVTYQSYVYFSSTVSNGSVGDELLPVASSGVHHVECSLTRNLDGAVMGTIVSNDFNVIDADVTGIEEIYVDDLTSVFFERSTAATPLLTVSVDFTDMYVGETYTADWELCYIAYNNCDLYNEMAASGGPDPAETEGQISFTPTTSSITQTFDFTDPGLFVDDGITSVSGIQNQSYHFRVTLSVQGVELDVNQSSDFILGGEMRDQSYINSLGNTLKDTPIEFNGRFYLDYENWNLMDYDLDCGLYHGTSLIPVDTHSYENLMFSFSYYNFYSSGGNTNTSTYDLIATTTTGTHHIECALTRNIDGTVMGKIIGNDFQVIDDTANQDDASIVVSVDMHADYQYGNITIVGSDLDGGQEYSYNWIVHDNTPIPPVTLMENDYIWVQGNGGSNEYVLEFHDLPDTTNACFSVTFYAGDTELQDVSGVCWISASTSDLDGDGVYDKNDLCDDTPANTVVQPDGCSDGDGDGFDSSYETSCGSDPNDVNSIPTDYDNDGTCDLLDTDADGDGFLNEDELLAGTLPLDETSFPVNRLPTCSLYYSLESEGMPTSFDGNAAIPALSGVTAQAGIDSIVPPVVTIPEGSYYMTAHCVDLDGDDITVTVNGITIGPVAGEVSAGALVVIGENVSETVDVTITWTDGSETLMTMVTVEMESDSTSPIPGFGLLVGLSALLMAGFVSRRKHEI